MRPEHKPLPAGAEICILCKWPALKHRVAHSPVGDPCESCGLPAENHRVKSAEDRAKENEVYRTAIADRPKPEGIRALRKREQEESVAPLVEAAKQAMRPEHKPLPAGAEICIICQHPASVHRVAHESVGDPCKTCGLPALNHRKKTDEERAKEDPKLRTSTIIEGVRSAEKRGVTYLPQVLRMKGHAEKADLKAQRAAEGLSEIYLGVDGEGQGRTKHAYVFLGASNTDGSRTYSVESPSWRSAWDPSFEYTDSDGTKRFGGYQGEVHTLPTAACMDFLLMLPAKARAFSFAFNYDLTKQLQEVDNEGLYTLYRPKNRRVKKIGKKFGADTKPVKILNKRYLIDLQGTKFTVQQPKGLTARKRIVWDIFKFYGSKFVTALEDWKVGTPELHKRMTTMKEKRGEFDKESPEDVEKYCLEECACMAQLAEKLDAAHIKAGIPLKKIGYYGAGSSATAMLKNMNILAQLFPLPDEMMGAIARAFFGGRFENAEIGEIYDPVYNRDISSAYPYQLMFLPCLKHGKWRHTNKRKDIDGKVALVHYMLDHQHSNLGYICESWAPFPFRLDNGSICYPATSGGGWVYQDEYLAGERLFPHVGFREAWVHESDCDCQPFERISYFYLYRLLIGKEGAGIAIKLAVNSCYGKLAQSVGSAKFNCWLWAGYITSGCRGQLLNLMGEAPSLRDILMVATDGIASRVWLPHPKPKDTGTDFLLNPATLRPDTALPNPKPLGGWEAPAEKTKDANGKTIDLLGPDGKPIERVNRRGLFLGRPGIYVPIDPSEEDMKEIKARGIGRGVLLDNYERIIKSWRDNGPVNVKVANISRFCGAKTSISRSGKPRNFTYTRASGGLKKNARGEMRLSPSYGDWIVREVEMSFDPLPKREKINKDGRTLAVRYLPHDRESMPYKKVHADRSPEAKELKRAQEIVEEQPDVDFSVFGDFVDSDM